MGITEISVLAGAPNTDRSAPTNANAVAVEFDAMIWDMLLRESGLLRAFGPDEGGETALLGEMFVHDFARQLAAQMDTGFGRMALATAPTQTQGTEK